MQLTRLVKQCTALTKRLEALQAKNPARVQPQPLFAISGLSSDLQRVYAVEWILMQLSAGMGVTEAIGDLLETISVTYASLK